MRSASVATAARARWSTLSSAWGAATWLHDKAQCFTLFATHYFEFTEFAARHRAAVNVHVSAVETDDGGNSAGSGAGGIAFLHEIRPGPASRSYGVQVARLAGMPAAVLHHARHALTELEQAAAGQQRQADLLWGGPFLIVSHFLQH